MTASGGERPPIEVLAAWGAEDARVEPIEIGLINRTFRVDAPRLALQRLHPIFAGEVNLDIDAITQHLERRGLLTPRPVATRGGALWMVHEGSTWRALTWLEGRVHTALRSPAVARAAGELVGRFHRALDGFEHAFHFERPGAHDTAAHLGRLEAALALDSGNAREARALGEAILAHAASLPPLAKTLTRIIHGDLKISNVLFDAADERALALLDLDTIAHGIVAHEIGDALRSWCNPAGESAEDAAVDEAIFAGALEGWAVAMRGTLDHDELASIVPGLETIALELAARFALDAIEDRYFGWDRSRYASRIEHNRARARSQLALARSVRVRRASLEAIVARAFA